MTDTTSRAVCANRISMIDKGLTLDITVSFVDLAGRERQLALRKRLEPFDIEEISPGGGGYLDALERERARVLRFADRRASFLNMLSASIAYELLEGLYQHAQRP